MYYLVNVDELWEGMEQHGKLFSSRSLGEVIVTRDRFMDVLDELALIAQDEPSVQVVTNLPDDSGNVFYLEVMDHWIAYLCTPEYVHDLQSFQQVTKNNQKKHTFILYSPRKGLRGYVPITDND